MSTPSPLPIIAQPSRAVVKANDAHGPGALEMSDYGGQLLHFEFFSMDGTPAANFSFTREVARQIIAWLNSAS